NGSSTEKKLSTMFSGSGARSHSRTSKRNTNAAPDANTQAPNAMKSRLRSSSKCSMRVKAPLLRTAVQRAARREEGEAVGPSRVPPRYRRAVCVSAPSSWPALSGLVGAAFGRVGLRSGGSGGCRHGRGLRRFGHLFVDVLAHVLDPFAELADGLAAT